MLFFKDFYNLINLIPLFYILISSINYMPTSINYIKVAGSSKNVEPNGVNLFHKIISYIKAHKQASSIMVGLEQAKAIKSGKRSAKSFEEAIGEL